MSRALGVERTICTLLPVSHKTQMNFEAAWHCRATQRCLTPENWENLAGNGCQPFPNLIIRRTRMYEPLITTATARPTQLEIGSAGAFLGSPVSTHGSATPHHSRTAIRAGQAGASPRKIREQTGHASDAMLVHYIRNGEFFPTKQRWRILTDIAATLLPG
jgi:hypothetical protein